MSLTLSCRNPALSVSGTASSEALRRLSSGRQVAAIPGDLSGTLQAEALFRDAEARAGFLGISAEALEETAERLDRLRETVRRDPETLPVADDVLKTLANQGYGLVDERTTPASLRDVLAGALRNDPATAARVLDRVREEVEALRSRLEDASPARLERSLATMHRAMLNIEETERGVRLAEPALVRSAPARRENVRLG